MKPLPGEKCVHDLWAIPNLVESKTYVLPFTGILRCHGTEVIIPFERVVNISRVGDKARIEILLDVRDELRYELEKFKDGKLILERDMGGGKVKLSVLISPDDPWDFKPGRDAKKELIFINDLNA